MNAQFHLIYKHPILSKLIKNDVTIYGKFVRSVIFEKQSIKDYVS